MNSEEIREITPEDIDEGREQSVREKRKREKNQNRIETEEDKEAQKLIEEKKLRKTVYKKIIVDLRGTKFHTDEWGIKLDQQRQSKSRQWTKDMDTIGDVKINNKAWGKLGIREEKWKKVDPLKKRFVMKLFTNSFYWRGTIEFLQGESVLLSYVTNENCPVYMCNISTSLNLVRIRRLPHKPRFRGEVFGFELVDDNGIHNVFMIDDKRFTLGSDWYVKDVHKNIVAIINGKFFNVGGRYDIEIYDKKLASNKEFFSTLILFASTLRWHKDIKKLLKKVMYEIRRKNQTLKLQESEADLYLNPRKMNY
ncbi:MAG: hypothetical protein ACTSVB_11565 [Candidatus Heimdallarchaeaceae archaeon]